MSPGEARSRSSRDDKAAGQWSFVNDVYELQIISGKEQEAISEQ